MQPLSLRCHLFVSMGMDWSPSGIIFLLYTHFHEGYLTPAVICLQLLSLFPLKMTLSLKCSNHKQ